MATIKLISVAVGYAEYVCLCVRAVVCFCKIQEFLKDD